MTSERITRSGRKKLKLNLNAKKNQPKQKEIPVEIDTNKDPNYPIQLRTLFNKIDLNEYFLTEDEFSTTETNSTEHSSTEEQDNSNTPKAIKRPRKTALDSKASSPKLTINSLPPPILDSNIIMRSS